MKITLIRGDERVEIEGDDALIHESLCYQGTWERRASEVVQAFYARSVPKEVVTAILHGADAHG